MLHRHDALPTRLLSEHQWELFRANSDISSQVLNVGCDPQEATGSARDKSTEFAQQLAFVFSALFGSCLAQRRPISMDEITPSLAAV